MYMCDFMTNRLYKYFVVFVILLVCLLIVTLDLNLLTVL